MGVAGDLPFGRRFYRFWKIAHNEGPPEAVNDWADVFLALDHLRPDRDLDDPFHSSLEVDLVGRSIVTIRRLGFVAGGAAGVGWIEPLNKIFELIPIFVGQSIPVALVAIDIKGLVGGG